PAPRRARRDDERRGREGDLGRGRYRRDSGVAGRARGVERRHAGDPERAERRRARVRGRRLAAPRRRRRAALRRGAEEGLLHPNLQGVIMDRWLAFFRRRPPTAALAKERLRIIVAQERRQRGGPDFLPLLRGELLEVIRKYVQVDVDRIEINYESQEGHDVLELSVALPQRNAA